LVCYERVKECLHKPAYIYALAVLPKARRQGVGSALLAAVEKEVRLKKLDDVFLHCGNCEVSLHAFYAQNGYTWHQRTEEEVVPGEVSLLFHKGLEEKSAHV
jgi:ribosomal protein S18 acetylase RimI-like enzyme